MKKIGKAIGRFFAAIYRIIDKLIVTPISRLIFNIREYLRSKNIKLDYIFNRRNFMIYVSLILAVIVFVLIDSRVITLVESEAEVITNIPVTVNYNEEAYVVEGIPETVDIVLIGRKSDIYLAKQLGTNNVILDLSDYEARDSAYRVYLSYTKSIDSIDYKLDPSYVTVTIKDKISVTKDIDYDLINEQYLSEELSVESVELSRSEVVVKGSEDAINNIASVKALIDLSDDALTDVGTYTVNIRLVAYDSNGEVLNNIEIVPTTLTATVTLDTYSKSVPIQVRTTGSLVTGKAIASIMINNSNSYSVTIYGDEEQISNIANVPVTINVDGEGANSTRNYNVTISRPTGVRALSENNASITVTFGDERQKEVELSTISSRNLASGYTANIVGTSSVPVIVKGVQSVIDDVDTSNINAYIDLEGYTPGEYDVEVKIENDDPRLNFVVSSTVHVRISNE